MSNQKKNIIEWFYSQIHYTWWLINSLLFRTLHEHTLACDVIFVARQRISCVCFCWNVNNGKERETTLLMCCLTSQPSYTCCVSKTEPLLLLHLFLLPSPKKEVLFLLRSVYLSVCLPVGSLKKLRTDSDEISWRGRAWPMDQVITFWWRFGSPSGSKSPKSEIRIHWIIEKVPNGLRSKLHS